MPYLILSFVFLSGLIIGSFLNCLIWRLHTGESIGGRSYCPKCRKQIAWYDNIPVFSFLILRGKCRNCRQGISWQYPIVELITGILFVIAWIFESGIMNYESWFFLDTVIHNSRFMLQVFRDWLIIAVMIIIFIYDLRWYLILDKITLPASALFFILNILLGSSWQSLLISGIIGAGFFLLQFVVSKGKWIGGGDIRMGFLMGVILGWPHIILALFLAYILGSIIGVGLLLFKGKKWGSEIPFGTFLAVATLITLFLGERILDWYFNLILF